MDHVGGSFQQPLTDPGVDPTSGPLVALLFNRTWKSLLGGAALQLLMPASWDYATESDLNTVLDEAILLFNAILAAETAPEYGMVSITITAGNATATAAITFPVAFPSAPVVLCSGDSGTVICSAESITSTGFTARVTSNVVLGADHSESVSWQAGMAS